MSTPIENNTEELRNILQQVNELPNAEDTPSDAVRYTEQELTPEQQAQARENIEAVSDSHFRSEIDRVDILKKDTSLWYPVNELAGIEWDADGT